MCFIILPLLLISTLKLHSGAALETGFGAATAVPCGLNGRHAAHGALVRSRRISCIGIDAAAELEAGFGASKAVCPVINLHPPFNGLPPARPGDCLGVELQWPRRISGGGLHAHQNVFIILPPFINLRLVC